MIQNPSKRMLNICYATDNRYLTYTTASIYSIIRRKDPETQIRFYILGNKLTPDEAQQLKVFNRVDHVDAIVTDIDVDKIIKQNHIDAAHGSVAFAKFLLPEIFLHLDRILFLDGDIIARQDISNVYHADLDGYSIGMVKDAGGVVLQGLGEWPQSFYFHKDFYFNTGIILMDLKKMRENKTHVKWIRHLEAYGPMGPLYDQPIINYYNHYDCKILPPTYQLSYHNLIRYPEPHIHKIERWNAYYGTHYSSLKEMVDASYLWHFHENKQQMRSQYPLIDHIFRRLEEDYKDFVTTETVRPWKPEDDADFYLDPARLERRS